MICPYNHMKINQVEQDTYEYDTDGRVTFHQHTLSEGRKFGECAEKGCALYRNGKCFYNVTEYDALEDYLPGGPAGCEDEVEE